MIKLWITFLIISVPVFFASNAAANEEASFTLEMAKKMADACEALAEKKSWRKINIAIYDDGGNLKLFRRQDNSYLHSIKIAQLKAQTSAGLPMSTRQLGDLAFKDKERPHGIEYVEGFVVFPGGLPILTSNGVQLGGIGVSGATAAQDEECAQAGLEAISKELD